MCLAQPVLGVILSDLALAELEARRTRLLEELAGIGDSSEVVQ